MAPGMGMQIYVIGSGGGGAILSCSVERQTHRVANSSPRWPKVSLDKSSVHRGD